MAVVPQFRELQTKAVKAAPYNPKSRTEARALKLLIRMISKFGMPYPILVTNDKVIIDGHRRLAAAQALEMPTIPAFVLDIDSKAIYAGLNAATRKMTGNEYLNVWMVEPQAVLPEMAEKFDAMERDLGRVLMRRIAALRTGSLRYHRSVREVLRYTGGAESPLTAKQVATWLLDTVNSTDVNTAIRNKIPVASLIASVQNNDGIELKYAVRR